IDPVLAAERLTLAADHARRISLRIIPLIAVTGPDTVRMTHEETRLDQAYLQREVLDEHRTRRWPPVAAGHHRDVLTGRQPEPARLVGAVGPELCVGRERNQTGRRLRGIARAHAAGIAEQGGNGVIAACGLLDPLQAARVVDDIELAV